MESRNIYRLGVMNDIQSVALDYQTSDKCQELIVESSLYANLRGIATTV
jgi:hypothetical protein